MIIRFLRENVYASYFLALIRVYLGWAWLTAGWGKLSKGNFDATGFLVGAVKKASGDHPAVQGWWASFLENFAIPNVGIFNLLIPIGEFLVGFGLLVGGLTTAAVFFGMVMNFSFLFSGTTSTNVQMILLSIFVIVAGANAGRLGIDYYILPYLRKHIPFLNTFNSRKLA